MNLVIVLCISCLQSCRLNVTNNKISKKTERPKTKLYTYCLRENSGLSSLEAPLSLSLIAL